MSYADYKNILHLAVSQRHIQTHKGTFYLHRNGWNRMILQELHTFGEFYPKVLQIYCNSDSNFLCLFRYGIKSMIGVLK